MALQVNQWEKLISGKSIPVCRPTEVLLGDYKLTKHGSALTHLLFENESNTGLENLKSCWHYFVKKYKCYFVKEQLDGNKVDCYFYYRFQFKKLKNHKEKVSGVFSLQNDKTSGIKSHGFYYVSDSYGFAIMHVDVWNKLKIYYCDIQTESTKYAEISFKYKKFFSNQIKLFKSVIWITRRKDAYCGIEAVIIKDQTWYHINSGISHPLPSEVVFSTDRFIGGIGGRYPLFSSCKMLYIDCDHLKPNQESQAEFRKFEKPNLQENEKNFRVVSVFNETVIATGEYMSCFLFISYRGFQIKLSRKIDASSCFQNYPPLLWKYPSDIYFLPGAARMAVRTDKNFIFIIDLRIFQITQMLTFRKSLSSYFLKFKHSQYDRALYLLGGYYGWVGQYVEIGEFILKFNIWQGMSLRELCISVIVDYFSVREIKSFSLPQVLIKEILSFKLY